MISIIVVNYNGGAALSNCITNALLSNVPVEIFVVDNASSDQSIAHLQTAFAKETRLKIVKSMQNQGFAKAVNSVLPQTVGDFVLILNPDCFIKNDTLQQCRVFMAHTPRAGMCGVLVCDPDDTPQQSSRRADPVPLRAFVQGFGLTRFLPKYAVDLSQTPLPSQPIEVEGISGAFMFVRREALEQIGGLDEGYFLHCEDLDWFKRVRLSHWQLWFLPHIKVIHLKGECSASQPLKVEFYKHRGMIRYYRKFFSQQYSKVLLIFIIFGVWLRFSLLASRRLLSGFLMRKK
ncbi:MAG: hypothetical protein RIT27_1389 [Pseudomonadota bacterium]|jgi:GT2 family glycosyltransferase